MTLTVVGCDPNGWVYEMANDASPPARPNDPVQSPQLFDALTAVDCPVATCACDACGSEPLWLAALPYASVVDGIALTTLIVIERSAMP